LGVLWNHKVCKINIPMSLIKHSNERGKGSLKECLMLLDETVMNRFTISAWYYTLKM
jgi:hypothetical protein